MKLKCPNYKCEYIWDYGGEATFFACCPRCGWRVPLRGCQVEDNAPEGEGVGGRQEV